MRLRVFASDMGDCLLLTSDDANGDPHHMLVDGGMFDSYDRAVAHALHELRTRGEVLDVVCVSHVDQDHIAGILRLFDDEVAWRVHDYQVGTRGAVDRPKPRRPRPPEVKNVWHNSFYDQVSSNQGALEDLLVNDAQALELGLSTAAETLGATGDAALLREALALQNLTSSIRQGLMLSNRLGAEQLGVPRNDIADGGFILVYEDDDPYTLGSASIRVIGPFLEDIAELRKKWNRWLRSNESAVARIRRAAERDAGRLDSDGVESVIAPLRGLSDELGNRERVTVQNLASIMLLVEEDGARVVLTGDGHGDDILEGLAAIGEGGPQHVEVLKVQHHGSEHNIDAEFCETLTADTYVFCGNGAHHNPEIAVVETIVEAREGDEKPYQLLFNAAPHAQSVDNPVYREHMRDLRNRVRDLAAASGGRLKFKFHRGKSFLVEV